MKRRTIAIGTAWALMVLASCGTDIPRGEATSENAIAAYVWLSNDRLAADDLFDPITKAAEGEPRSPAGFIRGLRSASAVQDDVAGGFGLQLVFQADVTTDDRVLLGKKADGLGLATVWLGPADEWPYCAGEEDCFLVGDTPSLP